MFKVGDWIESKDRGHPDNKPIYFYVVGIEPGAMFLLAYTDMGKLISTAGPLRYNNPNQRKMLSKEYPKDADIPAGV